MSGRTYAPLPPEESRIVAVPLLTEVVVDSPGQDFKKDDMEENCLKEGEIVKGSVLHIGENEVQINVGFKSEGYISRGEFGSEEVTVGDEVDVCLIGDGRPHPENTSPG